MKMTSLRGPLKSLFTRRLSPRDAYQLWAASYDSQEGNLLFHYDDVLMRPYFEHRFFAAKDVLDFGCGTGRHWPGVLAQKPLSLTGIDVSPAMIARLKNKFPKADAFVVDTSYAIAEGENRQYDAIMCNLVLDYVPDLHQLFRSWHGWLKHNGEILLTDLHPHTSRKQVARSFSHRGRTYEIAHRQWDLEQISTILQKNGLWVADTCEVVIDADAESFFTDAEAFAEWRGLPVMYGLRVVHAGVEPTAR